MKRFLIKSLLVIIALVFLAVTILAESPDKEKDEIAIMLQSLEACHFSPLKIDNQLADRVFKLYLTSLDPNKHFFLQSDVAQLKQYQAKLATQLENGSNEFFDMAWIILRQRIEEAKGLAQEILKQPFDFSVNESFETDPEKRDFPKGPQELKDQWRLYLKYQTLLTYLDLINAKNQTTASQDATKTVPISAQPFQPEIESQAREKVAQNLQRSLTRLLQEDNVNRFGKYLNAIAGSFDPHTEYFLPEQKDDFNTSINGIMVGIGASLQEDGDYIKVVDIIAGSPAWRQKGLQANDLILKVAQGGGEPVDIATMPIDEVVKLIRGEKGTEVRLTVKKPDGQIVVIPIIRDVVVMEETYAKAAIIDDEDSGMHYGYIDLPSFYRDFETNSRSSAADIKTELQELNADKVNGVILDLRNNGGGSLDDAVKMASLFIKGGPIVQVKDNKGHTEALSDPETRIVYNGPLIILVNSLSASASEVLTGALQDYGRAIIVGGPRTFGKGTVQTMIDFDQYLPAEIKPAGTLKVTIAKFYRISGGSNQEKGIIADIPLPDLYSYLDTGEKTLKYPLPWDTITSVPYQKWTAVRVNIGHLKQLSQERIQKSKAFKLIIDDLAHIKKQREKSQETLKFSSFITEQQYLQEEANELKNLSFEQSPNVKIISPQTDANVDQTEKTADWFKQIKQDVYINEAWHILDNVVEQKE